MRSTFASVAAFLSLFALTAPLFGCSRLPAGFRDMCDGDVPDVTAGVSGVPAYDSVEIIDNGVAVDSTGTPCATATNGDCLVAYARAKKEVGRRFVTTRRDEVVVRENISIIELGKSVDTEQEATLTAFNQTLYTLCKNDVAVGARTVETGFEVVLASYGTGDCAKNIETRVLVQRNGAISAVTTKTEVGYACPNQRESPYQSEEQQDNTFGE